MLFTCVTFVFFTILVAVISYVKTKGDDQTTVDGYFLAGRGLPGCRYRRLAAADQPFCRAACRHKRPDLGDWHESDGVRSNGGDRTHRAGVVCRAALPEKCGITTIPQLLGERYDRPTKLWFSIAYIILYLFVQIPVILYSGSLVFENIFNLSGILGITKFQSIVILCILITIIGSIYAIFGGLKAVAVSGYHQRRGPADRRSDDPVSGTQRARSCLRQ